MAGSTSYRMPKDADGVALQTDCTGTETDPDEVAWWNWPLVTVWDAQTVNGATALPNAYDGFCAIADVFGADPARANPNNPLDGMPEVITIAAGHLNVFCQRPGRHLESPGSTSKQVAVHVDDFDGRGGLRLCLRAFRPRRRSARPGWA